MLDPDDLFTDDVLIYSLSKWEVGILEKGILVLASPIEWV